MIFKLVLLIEEVSFWYKHYAKMTLSWEKLTLRSVKYIFDFVILFNLISTLGVW